MLVGCMFCCFIAVCCVVYMRDSDWLDFVVLVLIGSTAALVLVLAVSVVVYFDWYGFGCWGNVCFAVGGCLAVVVVVVVNCAICGCLVLLWVLWLRELLVLVICFGVLFCLVGCCCIAYYYCLLVVWYFRVVLLVWLITFDGC